jgi:hypothetical protein
MTILASNPRRIRRSPEQIASDHAPNLFITVSDQHRLIHILEDQREMVTGVVAKRRLTKLIDKLYAVKWA